SFDGSRTSGLTAPGWLYGVPGGCGALPGGELAPREHPPKNRRYAYFALAVVAMLLPGTDPVTMLIELAPLLALFELSLILARMMGRPAERGGGAEAEPPASPAS